jgi:lipid-A-disaccharide synthase-like uncharacterized protein
MSRCLLLLLPLLLVGAVPFQLSDRLADVQIERAADGSPTFVFRDGTALDSEAFATALDRANDGRTARSWWQRGLNITSVGGVIWVGLGLLGQVMFTGRMVVQWLVSEKSRRSVVPPAFWWMSLGGATLLLSYFIWRVDIVGVLGQSTGFFIYLRNLWLIYLTPTDAASA